MTTEERITYIKNWILKYCKSMPKEPDCLVIGISGGIDSSVTSAICALTGKKIIVGGSNLVLADVPTPVYLPFAYFPLTDKRTSGFIIPSWGDSNSQGFFLQNGGYYFAINDYAISMYKYTNLYINLYIQTAKKRITRVYQEQLKMWESLIITTIVVTKA